VPLPDDVRFVTFDCYGTLIDWETGVYEAFRKEAERDGFTIDREECVELFLTISREIQGGSYELYAEVLRRTAVRAAREMGWELEPSRSGFLPGSVPYWPPFEETNREVGGLVGRFELGLLSNIDDKLLGATRRHFRFDLDLVVTAQQVRSYKPDPAHFKECERRIGGKKGWLHVASGWAADIEPCAKQKVPVVWVNRRGEEPPEGAKGQPAEVVTDLASAVALLPGP
jgi:2-haloacid dehalogenase/putative hydrolase of the HAD superfamily